MSDWRPAASRAMLERRGRLLADLRAFFAARGVLEVQTPVIGAAGIPDPNIPAMTAEPGLAAANGRWYLQSSPECAMKRLLAAGSGPIYQVTPAFRAGERGRLHNPEFTLLEWYRPGFDHHALMVELGELLVALGLPAVAGRCSYRDAFLMHAGLDPHTAPHAALREAAAAAGFEGAAAAGRDALLDHLLARQVGPRLGRAGPELLYDYPATQAALARLNPGSPATAARFELFLDGIELANGYHELRDAAEQRARFAAENRRRRAAGLPEIAADARLLAALAHGLPDCAGVALGLDRLLMLLAGSHRIDEVLAFPIERA